MPSREEPDETETVTDLEVDSLIYEFKGDHREAIRALLHDIKVLAADHRASVSSGYVRGQVWRVRTSRGLA